MAHPIIEDLLWRRTAKKYDLSRKVSDEDLSVLLEALRLSASSINSQPWKFIVIESDAAKERMSQTFTGLNRFNKPHVFESSHMILFAYNPRFRKDDFAKVVDKGIEDGRVKPEERDKAFGSFRFAELNTDKEGNTGCWTKAQTYIALGNALHVLARLRIDSTPLEGIDVQAVNEAFKKELDGFQCDVALAIGYSDPTKDYNTALPKSRLSLDSVVVRI